MKTEFTITEGYYLTKEKLKQSLYVISYYLIAVVLLVSGISKILNPENLLNTLNTTLTLLYENIIILIATALPVLEITIGLMLLLKIRVKETLITALLLFSAFLIYSVYGTIKGFDVDCGCFGKSISSEFGIGMIVRNLLLLLLSIIVYRIKDIIELKKSSVLNNNYK